MRNISTEKKFKFARLPFEAIATVEQLKTT